MSATIARTNAAYLISISIQTDIIHEPICYLKYLKQLPSDIGFNKLRDCSELFKIEFIGLHFLTVYCFVLN